MQITDDDDRKPYLDWRAGEIFRANQLTLWKRVDRMFAYLMIVQWVASILVALWVSPLRWAGVISDVHVHVWAALFLGGLITAFPVALAFMEPGRAVTRHTIAVGQILMSCLLIHLTGGRIETHFHVFCSLAFLSLYRDWRVLVLPTLIVGADHCIRGLLWPQSVYGVTLIEPFRWIEHIGWVLFEDLVLTVSSIVGIRELKQDSYNQALLEQTKQLVEEAVISRTAELEIARDQALAASRAKSQFVANMSHEVRTPMAGIMGLTELLIKDEENPTKRDKLKTVFSISESLMSILNDILDFSKLEAEKLSVEMVPFSPALVAEEVGHFMMPKATTKALFLGVSCADDLPRKVIGDPRRIRQILLNLVSNAIKFTDKGEITVQVSLVSKTDAIATVRFEVIDTGIGIDMTHSDRLFQPFEQLDGSATRRFGGTGLGLSICKRLIDLMGGNIGVSSTPQKGSVFWFELPMTVDVTGNQPALEPELETDTLVDVAIAPLILVAEDNEVLTRLIRNQLIHIGYRFKTASDGKEALALYLSQRFDLILMDCQMPQLDGYETTEEIRRIEQSKGKRTPIIAMTASAMAGDRERCLERGMDDYISKPFTQAELRSVIHRWIKREQSKPAGTTSGDHEIRAEQRVE